ncbi:MAG TPA: hypothetical protein VM656_13270 [Pyrinomonadaceae bacterium]|jgi:hypothetical protein|nr:hypothetical protein [Pyrinomonadaceae bacterium]
MKRSMKKTLWSIIVVVTSVCAVLGLTIARTIVNKHGSSLAASNQLPVARGPMQNLRFTLYDAGIFPQQQHARPGNVVISFEDRTHRSTGLVVQREAGALTDAVGQVRSASDQARGRAQFSLGIGRYVVFDARQSNNRAELVIEP